MRSPEASIDVFRFQVVLVYDDGIPFLSELSVRQPTNPQDVSHSLNARIKCMSPGDPRSQG